MSRRALFMLNDTITTISISEACTRLCWNYTAATVYMQYYIQWQFIFTITVLLVLKIIENGVRWTSPVPPSQQWHTMDTFLIRHEV